MQLRGYLEEDLRGKPAVIASFVEGVAGFVTLEAFGEADLGVLLRLEVFVQVLQAGSLAGVQQVFLGGHVLGVDDEREELIDFLLEFDDGVGEAADEGLVHEDEVREEVVAYEDAGFGFKCFGGGGDFQFLHGRVGEGGLTLGVDTEPTGIHFRNISAGQGFEDPTEACAGQ